MMNTRLIASFLLAFAALVPTGQAAGQIGGLIKKKVAEKVKGDDKKGDDKKDQAATKSEAETAQPSGSKLGRTLTEGTLVAFKKGLTAERDHRQGTLKFLASLKTREQYTSCTQAVATSPEYQKIIMSLGELGDNPSQEQLQKASQKMSADMAKLSKDKCGEDPGIYHGGWKDAQMREARAAGVKVFAAALTPGASSGPFFSFEEQAQDANYFYDLLLEWVPPFCNLPADAQRRAAEQGVSVPGTSKAMAYVYTAMEARLVMLQCQELMALISVLQ